MKRTIIAALLLGCSGTQNTTDSLNVSAGTTQGSFDSTGNSLQSTFNESSQATTDASAQTSQQLTGPLLTSVGVGASVTAIGVLIWALQPAAAAATPGAAQAFLRSHARQLRQDVALGAGPAIDDLAAAARIHPRNLSRFGRTLRGNRAELLELIDPDQLTPERAVTALQRIGAWAREDPELASDYRAFAAELAGG